MAKGHYEVRGYLYLQSSSENSDTVNDIRLKNNAGTFVIEKCTVANSTKGGGTWVAQSSGGDITFSVTRIENTTGSETLYNTAQRKFYLLDITNAASTYTVTISRKPSSGGTAANTNVEHYVLIRNTAAAAKTLVVQLETTGDKMDSEGLSAVAIPASGIYEVGYIWVARGNDNLCIITKSTLLSEITK